MTNADGRRNDEARMTRRNLRSLAYHFEHSGFLRASSFVIRASSFLDHGLALPRRLRCHWFRWRERLYIGLFKIVDVLEIFDRIFLGFPKYACADQVKNHVSNILAGMNAPVIENRHDQRPELLQRVLPHPSEQFRSTHMTHVSSLDFLLLFCGEIERVAQKNIRVPLVTRVAGDDRIKSFGKSNFLHE